MTVNRFEQIVSLLYIHDNKLTKGWGEPGYDRLHRDRPLIDKLNYNFDQCAEKEVHIEVDEQIIPIKWSHSFKMYMMKKPKNSMGHVRDLRILS